MKRIIFIFLIILSFEQTVCAQTNTFIPFEPDRKKDSLLIISKRDTLNVDFTEDGNSGYTDGNIYYSPDNLLRIIIISGEACGAYCSPMYYSEIQYQTKKGIHKNFELIGDISDIYILNSDPKMPEYLISDYAASRPRGIETGTERGFLHVQLADSLRFIPIKMLEGKDYKYFSLYTGVLCNEKPPKGKEMVDFPVIDINPKNFKIQYEALEYDDNNNKCYDHKGRFEFKNGQFIQISESRK